jgi:hypothetical protein
MMIQVNEVTSQVASGNAYTYVEMTCEKHTALVVVVRGGSNYIRVVVQNASNKAWKGMGKRFDTVADALAKYKTAAIRTMIQHAVEVAGA